jgi:hypothetical protein
MARLFPFTSTATALYPIVSICPKISQRGIVHLDHVLFRFVCAIELSSVSPKVSPSPTSKKEETRISPTKLRRST